MIKAKLEYIKGNYSFMNTFTINFVGEANVTNNLDTLFCDYLNVGERVLVEKMRYIAQEEKKNRGKRHTLYNQLAYIQANKKFRSWTKSSDSKTAKDIKSQIDALNDKNALLDVELDEINKQLSSISHLDSEDEINKHTLKVLGFKSSGKIQNGDLTKYVFEFDGDEQELNEKVLKKIEFLKKKIKTELQKFVQDRTENNGTTK